jgi:hypothetical protein
MGGIVKDKEENRARSLIIMWEIGKNQKMPVKAGIQDSKRIG